MGDAGSRMDENQTFSRGSEQDDRRVGRLYRRYFPYVLALFVAFSAISAIELYRLYQIEARTEDMLRERLSIRTVGTAHKLSEHLHGIPPLVEALAAAFSSPRRSERSISAALETTIRKNNELFEVGAALEPISGQRQDSPHYGLLNGKLNHFQLTYDYTRRAWFSETVGARANWFEPYFGETSQAMVVGYAHPFTATGEGASRNGVARANLSLNGIRRHLKRLGLGDDGYTFILSAKRKFIYHPIRRYTRENLSMEDIDSDGMHGDFFTRIGERMDTARDGILTLHDPISRKSAWVVFTPVTETGWTLVSVNIEDELKSDLLRESHLHRINALVLLTVSVLLLILCAGMRVRSRKGVDTAWLTSLAFSLTLLTALAVMGNYFHEYETSRGLETITNLQELDEIKKKHALRKHSAHQPVVSVPTGVFVQSVEFHSSNNVFITGYVWQRTPDKGVTPGLIFPEAVSGSEPRQVYRKQLGNETLTGWYFETVFRQPFDYGRYPLDKKDVWIRLWHGSLGENVVLVPDLSSYSVSSAELSPGIEESIVLSGWNLLSSGFQYVKHNYNSSFGFPVSAYQEGFPELYYTVRLERNFIDAFVTNLVPLIVVSVMLFAILLTITCDKEKAGLFGADAFSVVTSTAGLFFIVLVAHIQLRKEFNLPSIVYLEYFYLVMYFAILWVSVSGFLVTSAREGQLMHYRDGLFAKIFFWPMILVALLVVSYKVFI